MISILFSCNGQKFSSQYTQAISPKNLNFPWLKSQNFVAAILLSIIRAEFEILPQSAIIPKDAEM
jgi:hypothetical protein